MSLTQTLSDEDVPELVIKQFFGRQTIRLERLGNGEVNKTYLAKASNGAQSYVLQHMSPIFEPIILDDFAVVTKHLAEQGWQVPLSQLTVDGKAYVLDGRGGFWRLMTHIANQPLVKPQLSSGLLGEYGVLLARFHASLSALNYKPRYTIDHFHDTSYYAQRLQKLMPQITDAKAHVLSKQILRAYLDLPAQPDQVTQIIHGDPRTANMLFRKGHPFTYIDFDTIMLGSVWLDIGDLLRSLAEDSLRTAPEAFTPQMLRPVTDAYNKQSTSQSMSDYQFFRACLVAMRRIALELAMRYLIDIVEDYYWVWNSQRYNTRQASNLARAEEQWNIVARVIQ